MAIPLVIDTDGGVDDAVALWWAATNPEVDLLAVTIVWGNVSLKVAADAVLRVLHAAGRPDVPVAVGLDGPIGPAPETRPATFIHGDDGLGNTVDASIPFDGRVVDEPAIDLLCRLAAERPGEVTLVTIGPLSNVGRVVTDDAAFAPRIKELVVMGGATRRLGNASPMGEANVVHDPIAAQAVVAAAWNTPPLLVGLDVTHHATLSEREFDLIAEHRNAAATFLDGPLAFYRRFGSTFTAPETPCHDLVAVMAAVDPTVITDAPVLPLAVDCGGGPAWGATVVDFRAPYFAALEGSTQERPEGFADWRIGLHADVTKFRKEVRRFFT